MKVGGASVSYVIQSRVAIPSTPSALGIRYETTLEGRTVCMSVDVQFVISAFSSRLIISYRPKLTLSIHSGVGVSTYFNIKINVHGCTVKFVVLHAFSFANVERSAVT